MNEWMDGWFDGRMNFIYTRSLVILQLTLFRGGGGGGNLPAATLDVNSFLNIKENATKLGDFFF